MPTLPPPRITTPAFSAVRVLLVAAAACGIMLSATGCEEEVVAVSGTDRAFTLYGLVSPQLDSQWVYVFPIEDHLARLRPEPLDAIFTSTDLATGEERVWSDSLIQERNGDYVHVFWSPFAAAYGHAYRLHVKHPDGRSTQVTPVVPPRTEVVPGEPEIIPGGTVLLPVGIAGGAPRLLKIIATYTITCRDIEGANYAEAVAISYDGKQRKQDSDWVIPIDLRQDYGLVNDAMVRLARQPIDRSVGILLHNLTLRLMVVDEEWNPPGGVFDPELIVQPGVMENVQNGFGFVGAGYRLARTWIPPAAAVTAAGFRAPEE